MLRHIQADSGTYIHIIILSCSQTDHPCLGSFIIPVNYLSLFLLDPSLPTIVSREVEGAPCRGNSLEGDCEDDSCLYSDIDEAEAIDLKRGEERSEGSARFIYSLLHTPAAWTNFAWVILHCPPPPFPFATSPHSSLLLFLLPSYSFRCFSSFSFASSVFSCSSQHTFPPAGLIRIVTTDFKEFTAAFHKFLPASFTHTPIAS